jgi:thioredoxin 1
MNASFQNLVDSETPTVIDFFATWCGPCRLVGPILEDLKGDLGEDVRIFKIDVDKNQSIAEHFQVRSIPTLMVFQKGEMKWRESGVPSKTTLKKVISDLK